MKHKLIKLVQSLRSTRLSTAASFLLKDEAISGKLILVAVGLALIAANTPIASWYTSLLHTQLTVGIGSWNLSLDLTHWISEGLMTFFFLVVGLELKRELLEGELNNKQNAILPFAAALGGMLVPALLFLVFNIGKPTVGGWAIPMATDIALAVGVLSLLGKKIPSSIRIFLLALAIVDDIVAVLIIAVVFNTSLNITALVAVALVATFVYWLGKKHLLQMWMFIIAGLVLWLLTYIAGVQPSIIGALIGLIAPISAGKHNTKNIAQKTEKAIVPFSTLIVVPLFALTSAGISLSYSYHRVDNVVSLGAGIIVGLVIGKLVGILGTSWLMVKFGFAKLPSQANWLHIAGIGLLAGVGFTVALFVTDLAFTSSQYINVSKLSIFIASIVAACLGLATLRLAKLKSNL